MWFVQVVRVPEDGICAFQRFESAVLPLLPEYGGALERRLRTYDNRVEIHLVSFRSREALESYLADPRRQEHLHLLRESRAEAELFEVADVTNDDV
jgi:hypothetical protein